MLLLVLLFFVAFSFLIQVHASFLEFFFFFFFVVVVVVIFCFFMLLLLLISKMPCRLKLLSHLKARVTYQKRMSETWVIPQACVISLTGKD